MTQPTPDDPTVRQTRLNEPGDETLTLSPGAAREAGTGWRPGAVLADIYRIEHELARGGMGVVHLAEDLSNRRRVAIKSLLPEFARNTDYKRRFLREASAWVALGAHPYIIRAWSALEIDYLPHVIAEYAEDGSLHEFLRRGRAAMERALQLATEIAWGMDFAHSQGLAHRDLKPANILLDGAGHAKITDFGLAKSMNDAEETGTAAPEVAARPAMFEGSLLTLGVVGTPEYIAPEQWEGRGGKAADIYAYGVILYELFTGRRPFQLVGDTASSHGDRLCFYRETHTREAPPLPDALAAATPGGAPLPLALRELMLQCLDKNAGERPRSFADIADRLNNIAVEAYGRQAAPKPSTTELDSVNRLDQAYSYLRLAQGCIVRDEFKGIDTLIDQAEAIFGGLSHTEGLFAVYLQRAKMFCSLDEHAKARATLATWRALAEAANSRRNLGLIEAQLSVLDLRRLRLDDALAHCLSAVEHLTAAGDIMYSSRLHNNIGIIHIRQQRDAEAIPHFHQAIQCCELTQDEANLASCYLNLGIAQQNCNDLDSALTSFSRSLELCEKIDRHVLKAKNLHNLGVIEQLRGRPAESLAYLRPCCELKRKYSSPADLSNSLSSVARAHLALKQFDAARTTIDEVLACLKDSPRMDVGQHVQAEYYAELGDYVTALRYAEEALELHKINGSKYPSLEKFASDLRSRIAESGKSEGKV